MNDYVPSYFHIVGMMRAHDNQLRLRAFDETCRQAREKRILAGKRK